jgi:murein DD-endopeptidase MepM/ murein hydrolase activator NlpD
MATSSHRRPGALLSRLLLASVVWLTTLSLLLGFAPRGAAEDDSAAPAVVMWAWPLDPDPHVARAFDPPESPYGPGHRGVDLAAAPGQDVLVVADGVVTHSGEVAGRGTVTVRHANGVASTYEPLDERIAEGTVVSRREVLGTIGSSEHCAPTSCLHLGARLGGEYLDPLLLLARARIILLPLRDPPGSHRGSGAS